MLLTAVGVGLSWAGLFLTATTGVRMEEAGLASGLVNTSQQVGSALGLAALATVAASRTAHVLPSSPTAHQSADALVKGFQRGFLIAGIVVGATALLALVGLAGKAVSRGQAERARAADGAGPDDGAELGLGAPGSTDRPVDIPNAA